MRMWPYALLLIGFVLSNSAQSPIKHKNGIVDLPSKHSVDETIDRLKNIPGSASPTGAERDACSGARDERFG